MRHLTANRPRAVRWVTLAAWMGVIFLLSAQPSEESSALSGVVMQMVVAVLDWLARLFGADGFPAGALDVLHVMVRKTAHVVAYAVLGALALAALAGNPGDGGRDGSGRDGSGSPGGGRGDDVGGRGVIGWRMGALALGVSVAYAVTDELHQTFVPGRGGEATDVLVDASGALAGILLLRWWWGRRTPAGEVRGVARGIR